MRASRRPRATSVRISSVASFFVSRVDTEVDRRLDEIGTDAALGPAGHGRGRPGPGGLPAVPRARSSGPRWEALAARGARVQRPLWASTSTKNPRLPRHALRRHAHRARHRQHDARGHDRRVRRPRHGRPHGRRRPGGGRRPCSTRSADGRRRPRRRRPRCSRSRAWPRSASRSTSSSARSRPRPPSSGRAEQPVHGDLVVVDDVPGEFAERVIEAFHAPPQRRLLAGRVRRRDRPRAATSAWPTTPAPRSTGGRSTSTGATSAACPHDRPESNYHLGREALLERVGAVNANYPMFCDEGADPYQLRLGELGRLDVVHLGLGADGHMASLFPGSAGARRRPGPARRDERGPERPQPAPADDAHLRGIARARLVLVTVDRRGEARGAGPRRRRRPDLPRQPRPRRPGRLDRRPAPPPAERTAEPIAGRR